MKKNLGKRIRDIIIAFTAILIVRFILCYIYDTKFFTDTFILFISIFFVVSILFRFILKNKYDR